MQTTSEYSSVEPARNKEGSQVSRSVFIQTFNISANLCKKVIAFTGLATKSQSHHSARKLDFSVWMLLLEQLNGWNVVAILPTPDLKICRSEQQKQKCSMIFFFTWHIIFIYIAIVIIIRVNAQKNAYVHITLPLLSHRFISWVCFFLSFTAVEQLPLLLSSTIISFPRSANQWRCSVYYNVKCWPRCENNFLIQFYKKM